MLLNLDRSVTRLGYWVTRSLVETQDNFLELIKNWRDTCTRVLLSWYTFHLLLILFFCSDTFVVLNINWSVVALGINSSIVKVVRYYDIKGSYYHISSSLNRRHWDFNLLKFLWCGYIKKFGYDILCKVIYIFHSVTSSLYPKIQCWKFWIIWISKVDS